MNSKKYMLVISLLVFGILTRFFFLIPDFPHLPNFTGVGAVALFGGYIFKNLKTLFIPVAILWISDLVLNNVIYAEYYVGLSFWGNVWVYLVFAVIMLGSMRFLKKITVRNILVASLGSAVVFYLITNFSSWLSLPLYTKDIEGLIQSYINGIPFFRNTLIANVVYSGVLFGGYYFAMERKIQFSNSIDA